MSKKQIKIDSATLAGYEVVYSDSVFYDKDKTNTSVTVTLDINGELFSLTKHMWQFEVSEYLGKFGAEL